MSKLDDTFNIRALEEIEEIAENFKTDIVEVESERELDDLTDKAMKSFNEFKDFAETVEVKFAAPILEVAAKMFGHALNAKITKLDHRIQKYNIMLKSRRLDQNEMKKDDDGQIQGDGRVMDRNELIEMIKSANKKDEN